MRNLKEYLRPQSPEEAVRLKRDYGDRAYYLAGGSDLMVHRPESAEAVIDIRHAGLGYVMESDEGVTIGGAALLRDAEVAVDGIAGGMLGLAFEDTAPWLIRNAATVAGNIANASPAADSVPALIAADAQLVLLGEIEETVELADILTGPHRTSLNGRLIKEIRLPAAAHSRQGQFFKLSRSRSDIAQVNGAVAFRVEDGTLRDVRIALGAVAPTAIRASGAEEMLEGSRPGDVDLQAVAARVREEVSPISDWRASAEYRSRMSSVFVKRALESLLSDGRGVSA
jgi:carbon-monoxide dehydrogenase medium subunit